MDFLPVQNPLAVIWLYISVVLLLSKQFACANIPHSWLIQIQHQPVGIY